MSVLQITNVFKHSQSTGTARCVLLALADVASDDGEVCAYARSQMILGRKANCDERTVRRCLDALVKMGELVVLRRGDGRTSANYQIALPGRADCPPCPGEMPAQGGRDVPPISPSFPSLPLLTGAPPARSGQRRKSPRRKPGTTCPDDFKVTDAMAAWFVKEQIPGDLGELTKDFCGWHRAKGSLFVDWPQAWGNWMRKHKRDVANAHKVVEY